VKGQSKAGPLTIMVCHSFFQLMILVTLCLQARCSPLTFQKRGACATEDPSAGFLHEVGRLKSDEAKYASSQARQAPIEIETWFHIISSKSESTQVTDDMINSQVSCSFFRLRSQCSFILPTAFYSTTILCRFWHLLSITRRNSPYQ
jgi:hypothetical protein